MAHDSCAVCAKASGTKRCSQCLSTRYCSAECQLADWPAHKRACRPPEDDDVSGEALVVPEGVDAEVARMRVYLAEVSPITRRYMEGTRPRRSLDPTLIDEARVKLSEFKASPGFEFSPAVSIASQQVLLSMARTFWIWTVSRLTPEERERMAFMLNRTPSHGKRVPKFNGKKTVNKPGDCSARVYEGLFRCVHLLIVQIPGREDSEETKLWREFPEVAVVTWHED